MSLPLVTICSVFFVSIVAVSLLALAYSFFLIAAAILFMSLSATSETRLRSVRRFLIGRDVRQADAWKPYHAIHLFIHSAGWFTLGVLLLVFANVSIWNVIS